MSMGFLSILITIMLNEKIADMAIFFRFYFECKPRI